MEITIKGKCPHCSNDMNLTGILNTLRNDVLEIEKLTFDVLKRATFDAMYRENKPYPIPIKGYFMGFDYIIANAKSKKELLRIKSDILKTKVTVNKGVYEEIARQKLRLLDLIKYRLKETNNKVIYVNVYDTLLDDISNGMVMMSHSLMSELDVKEGDIIAIYGNRKTYAVIGATYIGDIGMNIIRADSMIRRNADVNSGDYVTVSKASLKPVKKIVLKDITDRGISKKSINVIKTELAGKPVAKGDMLRLSDIGNVKLEVVKVEPANEGIIDSKTRMGFKES